MGLSSLVYRRLDLPREITEEVPFVPLEGFWIDHGVVHGWNVENSFSFMTSKSGTNSKATDEEETDAIQAGVNGKLTFDLEKAAKKGKYEAEASVDYSHTWAEAKAVLKSATQGSSETLSYSCNGKDPSQTWARNLWQYVVR